MVFKIILRFLFRELEAEKLKNAIADETPKAGEYWVSCWGEKSPWPSSNCREVKILDAKSGWVRYYMSEFFPDERMKIDIFTMIYRKKD